MKYLLQKNVKNDLNYGQLKQLFKYSNPLEKLVLMIGTLIRYFLKRVGTLKHFFNRIGALKKTFSAG